MFCLLTDVNVRIIRQRQYRSARNVRFIAEALLEISAIGFQQTLVLPHGGHMALDSCTYSRPTNLVHIVQPPGMQQILFVAQIANVGMQVCLTEQTGAVTEIPNLPHPVVRIRRHGKDGCIRG